MVNETSDASYHSLIFDGGITREIARIPAHSNNGQAKTDHEIMSEAIQHIHAFTDAHNFKIPYTRIWNADGKTVFDVGSHTEYFLLVPAIKNES